jgi:hypothetical protein
VQVREDTASLRALVQRLRYECEQQQPGAEKRQRRVDDEIKQTELLQVELLRLKRG